MKNPGGFKPSFRISNRAMAALTRIERARRISRRREAFAGLVRQRARRELWSML
jgi:hypothetical protein